MEDPLFSGVNIRTLSFCKHTSLLSTTEPFYKHLHNFQLYPYVFLIGLCYVLICTPPFEFLSLRTGVSNVLLFPSTLPSSFISPVTPIVPSLPLASPATELCFHDDNGTYLQPLAPMTPPTTGQVREVLFFLLKKIFKNTIQRN